MKKLVLIALTLSLILSTAGCGGSSSGSSAAASAPAASSAAASSAEETPVEAVTITVGTRGTYPPYTYLDDAGNLTGFDIEVVRKLDELIPEIEVEFQTMDLSACFVALDAGQIDMIANQLAHNEERDSKYTFTEIPYGYGYNYITVRGDVDDIQSFEDMKGKIAAVTPTSTAAKLVAEFNETADEPIIVQNFDGGSAETMNQVATGQADVAFVGKATVQNAVESKGYDLKIVGDPVVSTPVYFILRQDDQGKDVAAKLDAALQTLIDDGTLVELSQEFLGEDITKPVE